MAFHKLYMIIIRRIKLYMLYINGSFATNINNKYYPTVRDSIGEITYNEGAFSWDLDE